jgi:hypothetical protein
MEVVRASFPAKQSIARPVTMVLRVRNSGSTAVPNVAVSVDSFNYISKYPELAARSRPVWAIERGPGGIARPPVESQEVSQPGSGQTAYVNTWALGPLAAGQARTFRWRVTPVQAGPHLVHYRVAAGLAGHARARQASGAPVLGAFAVRVTPAPPTTYVDPTTGRVVEGTLPPKTP